jgi:hypothetical protein
VDNRAVELWLRSSLALQLLVSLPLVMSEGFGIFSEGSRIAYLESSGAAKYLTYAGVLLAPVQAGLLAQRLSGGHSPGATGYAVIASTFALSTLSGSKGGIFLWLASTLALTDYRRLRIRWMPILAGLIAVAVALVVTANIISETLGISEIEFAELAISRFFLNNDARALAFDFGGASRQPSELVSASFRSLSTLFGHGSIDPPLGLLLYERYFGVSTGNGPNASLIALIAYYSMRGYAMFPALIACLGLAAAYGGVVAFRHIVDGRHGYRTHTSATTVSRLSRVPVTRPACLRRGVPLHRYRSKVRWCQPPTTQYAHTTRHSSASSSRFLSPMPSLTAVCTASRVLSSARRSPK